jgi:signal transduction histidine kinase
VSTAIPVPGAAPQAPQPAQAPQAPLAAEPPLAPQPAQAPLAAQPPLAPQVPSQDQSAPRPPEDIARSLFVIGRRVSRRHPLLADTLLALAILAFATLWLSRSPFASPRAALVQAALIAPVAVRRVRPTSVFACLCAIALAQWLLGFPLIGDVALLVGLYTVAVHQSRARAIAAAAVLEAGAVMATFRWQLAGTPERSFFFITAMVVAAFFAGLTVASGSRYLAWLDERARRLETERDQQAVIAASGERTRIARELHDVVSHSLSVVVTLADAAVLVTRSDPERGAEAMAEVSEVGRHALTDMRAMLGVLRSQEQPGGPDRPGGQQEAILQPQPGVAQLGALAEGVRATGLDVGLAVEGRRFALGAAAELTVYRIVQEALTNTLRHATARRARVTIRYDAPDVEIEVVDDGSGGAASGPGEHDGQQGHGINGMRERAALHGGTLRAGPVPGGGWSVSALLPVGLAAG